MKIKDYAYHILLKSLISGICPEGRMPFRTHMLCCYYYVIHLLFWEWSSRGCSVSMWSASGTLDYKQPKLKSNGTLKATILIKKNKSGSQHLKHNNRFDQQARFLKGFAKLASARKLGY